MASQILTNSGARAEYFVILPCRLSLFVKTYIAIVSDLVDAFIIRESGYRSVNTGNEVSVG